MTSAAVAALLVALAAADDGEELFRPVTSGPFVTFTAPLTPPGRLLLQPIFSVNLVQTANFAERRRTDAFSTFVEYGLSRRFSLGGQLQVAANRAEVGEEAASSAGLSDTQLFTRAVLWHERGGHPLPEMTALLLLKIPTGRATPGGAGRLETDVTGTGTFDVTVGLDLTKGLRPFLLHLDLLGTASAATNRLGERYQPGPMLNWSLSLEWPFADGAYALMLEASGRHRASAKSGGVPVEGTAEQELVLGAGLELISTDLVQALGGVQRTVWSKNAPLTTSFIVTIVPVF